jgi:hypothetical protein
MGLNGYDLPYLMPLLDGFEPRSCFPGYLFASANPFMNRLSSRGKIDFSEIF